jgi:hypothetical protein
MELILKKCIELKISLYQCSNEGEEYTHCTSNRTNTTKGFNNGSRLVNKNKLVELSRFEDLILTKISILALMINFHKYQHDKIKDKVKETKSVYIEENSKEITLNDNTLLKRKNKQNVKRKKN